MKKTLIFCFFLLLATVGCQQQIFDDTNVDADVKEFDHILEVRTDRYILCVHSREDIYAEDDGFVFNGHKLYGGQVLISASEKKMIDDGYRMNVVYQEETMFCVTSEMVNNSKTGEVEPQYYVCQADNDMNRILVSFMSGKINSDRMKEQGDKSYSEEELQKTYYRLSYDYGLVYDIFLEDEFRCIVPKDTIIIPYPYYASRMGADEGEEINWEIDEYMARVINNENESWSGVYQIYEVDGQVSKIIEEYRP